jgi:hypothetical protein
LESCIPTSNERNASAAWETTNRCNMNIRTQITPLVKHWDVLYCWWRLIQAANNCQLLRNVKRRIMWTNSKYTITTKWSMENKSILQMRFYYSYFACFIGPFIAHITLLLTKLINCKDKTLQQNHKFYCWQS